MQNLAAQLTLRTDYLGDLQSLRRRHDSKAPALVIWSTCVSPPKICWFNLKTKTGVKTSTHTQPETKYNTQFCLSLSHTHTAHSLISFWLMLWLHDVHSIVTECSFFPCPHKPTALFSLLCLFPSFSQFLWSLSIRLLIPWSIRKDLPVCVIAKPIGIQLFWRMRAVLPSPCCRVDSGCQALIWFVLIPRTQQLLTFEIHSIIKGNQEREADWCAHLPLSCCLSLPLSLSAPLSLSLSPYPYLALCVFVSLFSFFYSPLG